MWHGARNALHAASASSHASRFLCCGRSMWKNNPNNFMQLPTYVREADDDGDGLISKDEFRKLLSKSGLSNMSEKEAQALFAKVDADGDGDLTMVELKQIAEMGRGKVKAQN